jgi:hypothetical protein
MHIMSPIYVGTFIAAVATVVLLAKRRFAIARFCAAAQVAFILWGWALASGGLLLFPSIFFLYHVFKIKRTTSSMPGDKLKEQQS